MVFGPYAIAKKLGGAIRKPFKLNANIPERAHRLLAVCDLGLPKPEFPYISEPLYEL
jgi:hypothetical protein